MATMYEMLIHGTADNKKIKRSFELIEQYLEGDNKSDQKFAMSFIGKLEDRHLQFLKQSKLSTDNADISLTVEELNRAVGVAIDKQVNILKERHIYDGNDE